MRLLCLFIYFFLWLTIGSLFSQSKKQFVSLKERLLLIEKKHEVKFSFSDVLVADKKVNNSSLKKTLQEILVELENKTGLIFKKVTERYILVLEKNANSAVLLCGFVLDKYSKTPIVGAHVYVKGNIIGATTNDKGYFELRGVKENDSLKISFLGYKPFIKVVSKLHEKKCINFEIEEYTSQLKEVLITSYLVNGIVKKKDGGIEISPQKRGILPGLTEPDVLQSLQLLPGIQSPNETTSGLHIRGGTPDQNLVLFDGIRIYNPAHFFGMISAFNPYIIDKVNVLGSGVAAEYGNHVAGVIDIRTDAKKVKKLSGGIGANLTHVDGFLKIPLGKKASVIVSGRRSLTDALNSVTFRKLSDRVFQNTIISRNAGNNNIDININNRFFFEDFHLKFLADISKQDKILLSQLYVNNKLNYRFGTTDNTFLQTDKLSVNNIGFSGKWHRQWNQSLQQETTFYVSNYELDYAYNGSQSIAPTFRESSVKKNAIKEIGFKSSFQKFFTKNHKLNFGVEYIKNKVGYTLARAYSTSPQNNYTTEEQGKSSIYALYSEYRYNKRKRFNVSLGLRNTYFSLEKEFFIAPRLFTQIRLWPSIWLNSSYEVKYQNISQLIEFSTSDFGLENKVWSLSNKEDIPILRANQFSSGLVFKKNGWLIDFNVFTKNIKGLTSLSRAVSSDSDVTSNGESNTFGITLLLKKKLGDYTSWVSYGFGETKFIFPLKNEGTPFFGNNDIRHNFNWSHSYTIGNFDLSLGWMFRTGVPYTGATEQINNGETIFVSNTINSSRLNNYHRLDFSSTYKFNISKNKRWKGKVGVSFLNIYDRRNTLQRRPIVVNNQGTDVLSNEETVSLGFTPNIVFRVQF